MQDGTIALRRCYHKIILLRFHYSTALLLTYYVDRVILKLGIADLMKRLRKSFVAQS